MRKGFFDAPRGHDGIQKDELDAWNLKQHNSELQKKSFEKWGSQSSECFYLAGLRVTC